MFVIAHYDCSIPQALAPSLVKILTDAGQEVPDWLVEEAAGGVSMGGGFDGSGFGSTDIRKVRLFFLNFFLNHLCQQNVPIAQAPVEDEWD